MEISFTRGNFYYTFNRHVKTEQSRESVMIDHIDRIELVSVLDKKSNTEINPVLHKNRISLSDWNGLIKDVRYYTCSICGEYCPKGECVNKRFHYPSGKK